MRQQRQALLAFLIHPPEDIADIFRQKQSVLAQAGSAIRQLAEQDKLWQREEEILLSLSHLLCNRLLGTQRTHEAEAYTFWYTTLKTRYHSPSRREA
jgi:thiopeptide-type bacteriocin biosynthesis protein